MKKLLTLFTLLLCVCSGAWATKGSTTQSITIGSTTYTFPGIPTSTLDLSSQTDYTPDEDGWIVSYTKGVVDSKTWWYCISTDGSSNKSWTVPSGTTAPFTNGSSSSYFTIQSGSSDGKKVHVLRFTGAEAASFLVSKDADDKVGTVSLFSYSGTTQTIVETKAASSTGLNELYFSGLSASTNYVAYIYGNAASNAIFYEFALKAPTTTTYTITLDDNGDYQGNGSATVKAGDTSLTISSQASRTGYSVSGYYAEAGCTTKIAEANGTLLASKTGFTDGDGKWTATEDKTLYAAWEAGKYTLIIAPNEAGYGTVDPTSVANVPYNTATSSSSNTFTVNGTTVTATAADATAEYTYAFSEWTDLPATVTEDATVTATFTRTPVNYTLAWNANGDGATLSGEYTSGSTPFGTTIVKPTATRDGYVLAGWATTAEGDVVEVTTMPAANTTYYAKWTPAVAPTFSVNYTNVSTPQNVGITFTASEVTGTPAPTITWYQSETAVASGGTSKGTGNSYSPSVTTIGTYYFYAVASNGVDPDANSGVITLTVAPKLNSLVYSNGFKAFIQQPSAGNGTIKAYYIAGTDAPTISSFTATTGATYNVVGNTLTLTAADGETTAVYDITLDPVTPYSGTGEYTFTSSDSWVKTGNSFSTGWKIARSFEDDANKKFMISTGSNRLYLFLAPSTSLTITQNGTYRDMLVSVDGGDAVEKSAKETFTVTGKDDAAYMVEISQKNSGGGDGKISKVNITKTGFESGIITASGWNTFSSSSKLDLSTIVGGKAYVATTKDNDNVTLTETSAKVAAGTGLMIKGTPNAPFKIGTTNEDSTYSGENLLVGLPTGGTVAANNDNYVFAWSTADVSTAGFYFVNDAEPILGANKAYLHAEGVTPAKLGIIIDDSETDGIRSIENSELRIENSDYYNLAGQKVGKDYKGIVIVNGKKYMNK